jgi:hypothetical protein
MATPEELVNAIIANAMATANEFTANVDTAAQNLIGVSGGSYYVPPATASGFEPAAIEPDIPTALDSSLTYEANLANIIALLSDQLADFFALYYPLASDAFDEAQAWLVNVITNGGTGINADIEAQVWQRARENIITDGTRVSNQIVTGYTGKGISMPAGSMLGKIDEARFAQVSATGEQATSIASKQLEIEIETVKFAVGKAIDSRTMAMNAAADYMKAVASAPGSAVEVANLQNDAQAALISASASWYNARLNRDDLILKSKLADSSALLDLWKGQKGFAVDAAGTDASALGSAADAYGKSAAAALASLNSIVSTAVNSFA